MSIRNETRGGQPRCGLCGKTGKLTKTACCGTWICDDEGNYVLFSFARNSCSRNHRRFTLCGFHSAEAHRGRWQDCATCRQSFETEMYVWYGTNEYNFEKLKNPPHYEPTRCDRCGTVIKLGTDGYSIGPRGKLCEQCTHLDDGLERRRPREPKRSPTPHRPKPGLPANANPGAIEIILSARTQKRWRIQPEVRASDLPAHWLGQWRIDLGHKPDRTWVALVTNTATLFTFVFPLAELAGGRNFEKLFRLRLGFALTDGSVLEPWKQAPLLFAQGNPRMVIGSMNDMRRHLAWRAETDDWGPIKDDEGWINKTPFLSLPETFPDKAFAKQLTAANTPEPP